MNGSIRELEESKRSTIPRPRVSIGAGSGYRIFLWQPFNLKMVELDTHLSSAMVDIALVIDPKKNKDMRPVKGFKAFHAKNRGHERTFGEAVLVREDLAQNFDQLPAFTDEEFRYILLFERVKWIAVGLISTTPGRLYHMVGSLGACGLPFIVGVTLSGGSKVADSILIKEFIKLLKFHGLYVISSKSFFERFKVVFNFYISNVNYHNSYVTCLGEDSNQPMLLKLDYQEFLREHQKIVRGSDDEEEGFAGFRSKKRQGKKEVVKIKQEPIKSEPPSPAPSGSRSPRILPPDMVMEVSSDSEVEETISPRSPEETVPYRSPVQESQFEEPSFSKVQSIYSRSESL